MPLCACVCVCICLYLYRSAQAAAYLAMEEDFDVECFNALCVVLEGGDGAGKAAACASDKSVVCVTPQYEALCKSVPLVYVRA